MSRTVKLKGIAEPVEVDQIVYVQGNVEYSLIHFVSGEVRRISTYTKKVHGLLPHFVRIHKFYLVNPVYLTGCRRSFDQKQHNIAKLSTGLNLPISVILWPKVVQQTGFSVRTRRRTPNPSSLCGANPK